ncbi:MAG: hypothetical protein QXR19_14270, partial [Candidatus Jordarchaeaceae archaeon]
IMQPEEWYVKEYGDIYLLLRPWGRYIYGTKKVPFKTIKKIFGEAEKQGKKTLTKTELKQKIMRECGATEEEAETAIYGADLTFKIRALQDPLWQMWNEEPFKGEPRYYWSGTTAGYPPLTHQDRIFTLITKSLQEAEKQGKQALTHRELVEGAYKNFEKYRWNPKSTVKRELEPELLETIIEDAQELQIITAHKENGETRYSLNHQILEATQKNKQQRKTRKPGRKPKNKRA